MGAGIVSHELTHAALAHMLDRGVRNFRLLRNDEKLAMIAGELNRKFWKGYYKLFPERSKGKKTGDIAFRGRKNS